MYSTQQGVPRTETQRSTQVSDVSQQSKSGDFFVNNLIYEQPKALSLAVNRTYNKQYFQRSDYQGGRQTTMICDWNTGTSYINAANSYLSFELRVVGGTANFASGSAVNLLNEIRIRSRSGTELDRLQNLNLWSRQTSLYTRSNEHLQTVGSVEGFGDQRSGPNDPPYLQDGQYVKFCIPLERLSLFFKPIKHQLIPPQLASGLHLEIVLEDFRTALFQKTGAITSYDLKSLEFHLDTVELTDDTQRALNMESASYGLEFAYERIFSATTQQPSLQTNVSQQIRKAVSQACLVTSMAISKADRIDITKDSMASIQFNFSSFQYRLGALYFPHQAINAATDGREAFIISQEVYDKLKHPNMPGSVKLTNFINGEGILSASFEKDTSLNMSGLPINNSRVLELNCEFANVTEPLEIISFLQYCSVARSFIDNTAVAI